MGKRKSKLEKIMESKEENLYETTVEDCEIWFKILNKELFDRKLKPIDAIEIKWRRKVYAYYEYKNNISKLCMNRKYKSKKFFIEVLAHEMVHHYQFMHNIPVDHDHIFMSWKKKFNQKGLNLEEAY